nr:hypothetical protein [Pseudomonas sp. AU10]
LYPSITPQILRPKDRMVAHPGVETIGRCLHRKSGKFCTLINMQQVPSKKNPEQTFGVFSANIENLDHLIIREAPGLQGH